MSIISFNFNINLHFHIDLSTTDEKTLTESKNQDYIIYVVCGSLGVGKTQLCNIILERFQQEAPYPATLLWCSATEDSQVYVIKSKKIVLLDTRGLNNDKKKIKTKYLKELLKGFYKIILVPLIRPGRMSDFEMNKINKIKECCFECIRLRHNNLRYNLLNQYCEVKILFTREWVTEEGIRGFIRTIEDGSTSNLIPKNEKAVARKFLKLLTKNDRGEYCNYLIWYEPFNNPEKLIKFHEYRSRVLNFLKI